MDSLTFWAEIIKALAWPLTILVIFLFLRRPLIQLIPMLQRFKVWDFELDFSVQVQELATRLKDELPQISTDKDGLGFLRQHLNDLATLSPRAVVLEAWLQLERAAIEASKRHGLGLTSRQMKAPLMLGAALEEAGIIDEGKQEIFHRLRNLRNAAAHASEFAFDSGSALEYADLALRLAEYFDTV